MNPRQFYLIVDKWGDIIAYRDFSWSPSDVSPYKVLHWTGVMFVEWKKYDF